VSGLVAAPAIEISVTDARAGSSVEGRIEAVRHLGDGDLHVALTALDRPGVQDGGFEAGWGRNSSEGGWDVTLGAAPGALITSRWSVRADLTRRIVATPTGALVATLGLSTRSWRDATLLSAAPALELYGRDDRWLRLSTSAGALDGDMATGISAAAGFAIGPRTGVRLFAGAGDEIEAGRRIRVDTAAASLTVPLVHRARLSIGVERTNRGDDVKPRYGLRLRLEGRRADGD
jgi:YaiO family outer membrane protein